jgi:hypothetical protein
MRAKVDAQNVSFRVMPRTNLAYANCGSERLAVVVSDRGAGAAAPSKRHCGLARLSAEDLLRSGPSAVWSGRNSYVRLPRGSSAKRQPSLIAWPPIIGAFASWFVVFVGSQIGEASAATTYASQLFVERFVEFLLALFGRCLRLFLRDAARRRLAVTNGSLTRRACLRLRESAAPTGPYHQNQDTYHRGQPHDTIPLHHGRPTSGVGRPSDRFWNSARHGISAIVSGSVPTKLCAASWYCIETCSMPPICES